MLSVDDRIQFKSRTPLQQHLATQLRRLDPALEGLYLEGLNLSARIAGAGVSYLLAHAGRELSRGAVRSLSEGKAALDESTAADTERNRTTIATVVELPAHHAVVTDWFRAHVTFADNCHYQPRPASADLVASAFERLENILFAVLAGFFHAKPELDRLLGVERPSLEDLTSLKAILARPALRQRFFQDVTSPGWLVSLRDWGAFAEPPTRDVREDGSWYARRWVEGAYLSRVAGAAPDLVADIFDTIPATNTNPEIWRIAVDAAMSAPAPHMRRIARLVKRALNAAPHSVASRDLVRLLERAVHERIPEVFRLVDAALAIDTAGGRPPGRFRHVDDFRLDQVFGKLIPALGAFDGNQTLELLVKKLRVVASGEHSDRTHPGSTRSWCRRIDQDDPRDGMPSRLAHGLFVHARRLCVDPGSTAATCAVLAAESGEIFHRILIRLLADVGELAPAYVDRLLVSDTAVEPPFRATEVALALRNQFGAASEAARRVFVYALERGPGLDDIVWDLRHGAIGEPISEPIKIDETVRQWQQSRLRWFQDRLPAELQALAAHVGVEPNALSAREQSLAETGTYSEVGSISVRGDRSPRTLDELRTMRVEELVAFLKGWIPTTQWSPFGSDEPTVDGLANVLCELATSDPVLLATLIVPANTDLAPAYLQALAKSVQKSVAAGTEVPWCEVFEFVAEILRKARTAIGVPAVVDEATQPWVWAARAGLELVKHAARADKVDAANVEAGWRVLELAVDIGGSFDGETEIASADDLVSAAVNRFSGETVAVVIEMELADRRMGSDVTHVKFTRLLDSVVSVGAKPALAELGRLLRYAVHLAPEWIEKSIGPLTDSRNVMSPAECPLFVGYLLGQHFDVRTFNMLRPVYKAAALLLEPSMTREDRWSVTEHLAQHAILATMCGVVVGDGADDLLSSLLDGVPVADRKQAYWLMYREISDTAATDAEAIVPRVLAFWEWRLGCLEASDPTDPQRADEANGLTWLFFANRLPPPQALPLARRTVELSKGQLALENMIWDRAVEFASIDPILTYRFVKPIVLATLRNDFVDLPEEGVKKVFRRALNSGDTETVSDVTALIHHVGEHGFDTFGELLDTIES